MWPSSKSSHVFTVDAGLQLGCCRADAPARLPQTASRLLLETCCRAGGLCFQSYFLASFGPRFGLVLASFWTRSEPPKICYQNVHESCVHIVFWSNRWHFLDVFVTLWTLQLDAVCNKRDILPKHTWIMRSHGVWLSKHIVLLIIFHSLKPLGWLAFWLCFAHLGW